MRIKVGRFHVVILLKAGDSQPLRQLRCVNVNCYHQMMMKTNRNVLLVLEDTQGIHWSEVPDDITVVEYKCRSCNYFYTIYTPQTAEAQDEASARLEAHTVI